MDTAAADALSLIQYPRLNVNYELKDYLSQFIKLAQEFRKINNL